MPLGSWLLVSTFRSLSRQTCHRLNQTLSGSHSAQVLGAIVFLAVTGTLYDNSTVLLITLLLSNTSTSLVPEVITGTNSRAFQSLSKELRRQAVV